MKIGIITTARSDYSYYRPLMMRLDADPDCFMTIFALGMHVSSDFGLTYKDIKADGFDVIVCEASFSSDDSPRGIAQNMGRTTDVFASTLAFHQVDVLVCLGDRYEMLAVVSAAVPFNIPLIHIHGGEITEGAIDNKFRHALTMFSDLHFPACERYRERIIQMGAHPETVFNFGSTCIESMRMTDFFSIGQLQTELGVNFSKETLLCSLHPVTREIEHSRSYVQEFIAALQDTNMQVVVTLGNADTYWNVFRSELQKSADENIFVFNNLGHRTYYSCMKNCYMLVGNSSSGIIEAASFDKPVVNIGNRQKGRECSANVIHAGHARDDIITAVKQAGRLVGTTFKNVYEGVNTSENIIRTIKHFDFTRRYSFYENSHGRLWQHCTTPHKKHKSNQTEC